MNEGLVVEGIAKRFGSVEVMRDVSLEAARGKLTALIGQNGAGKSTLFKILMGLVRPDAGRAALAGRDLLSLPLQEKAKAGLGYLPQECASFEELSIKENLLALLEILPLTKPERKERLSELLELMGLTAISDHPFKFLSRGEQRRLEIAKALAAKPKLLLLDEPFSGLDPRIVEEIAGILEKLAAAGIGILLTDHNIHMTLAFVDQVHLLTNGAILCRGTPAEIAANPEARQWYLGEGFRLENRSM